MIREIEYPAYSSRMALGKPSWGAIFGGAFVGTATLGMLSLLGLGIGLLSSARAGVLPGVTPTSGVGGAVWLFCTAILSAYFGGWITARMTHSSSPSDNAVHALVAWSLSTVVVVFMVGSMMGGALNVAAAEAGAPALSAATIGGFGLYAFAVLFCEAIAAVVGGQTGTRLFRPVATRSSHVGEPEREPHRVSP